MYQTKVRQEKQKQNKNVIADQSCHTTDNQEMFQYSMTCLMKI